MASGLGAPAATVIPTGTLAYTGTAVLDFGLTPNDYATVDVTGQTGILATSHVRVWFQAETMGDNSSDNHLLAAFFTRLATSDPVADTGFTVHCISKIGYFTKRFRVDWLWS